MSPNKRKHFLPMPVVVISTVDKEGNRNIAPYANVLPALRPLDMVAIASWFRRGTLGNIRDTKEFVINVPSADLVDEVMICSRNYPEAVDEFAEVNLGVKASQNVIAPLIEGCIAWVECTLDREVTEEGKYSIIEKVVHPGIDCRYLTENGDPDLEKSRPLSVMLGERDWNVLHSASGHWRLHEYTEMFIGGN
ncbi:MAG: flavin reductase family protein [Euryarchaeota archaeon]|nr:flavin reductase family protein [Euryarchaeota archaeon]